MLAKKQAYEEFSFFSYCVILLYFSKKGYSLHLFFLFLCGFWALSFLTYFLIPFFITVLCYSCFQNLHMSSENFSSSRSSIIELDSFGCFITPFCFIGTI